MHGPRRVSRVGHQQKTCLVPRSEASASHAPHHRIGRHIQRHPHGASYFVQCGLVVPVSSRLFAIVCRLSLYTRYVVLDAVSPIVVSFKQNLVLITLLMPRLVQGIVFSVIMLRIALGISTEDGETALLGAEDIRMSRMPSTGSNHKVHTFDHDVV